MWHVRRRKALHGGKFNLFPSVPVCEHPRLILWHIWIVKVLFSRRSKTFILQVYEVRSSVLVWREIGKRTEVIADWPKGQFAGGAGLVCAFILPNVIIQPSLAQGTYFTHRHPVLAGDLKGLWKSKPAKRTNGEDLNILCKSNSSSVLESLLLWRDFIVVWFFVVVCCCCCVGGLFLKGSKQHILLWKTDCSRTMVIKIELYNSSFWTTTPGYLFFILPNAQVYRSLPFCFSLLAGT